MNDMRAVIVPKSDQLNADDLLAGPITITITEVSIRPGTEQPVSIRFDGDGGKPYKPCKSMARVMVHCWGADANEYIGRSLTLYCDPKVLWGGMAVGGIRISHLSHINNAHTMALTATKGKKHPFTVEPIKATAPPPAPKEPKAPSDDALMRGIKSALTKAETLDRWKEITNDPRAQPFKERLKIEIQAAYDRLNTEAAHEPVENFDWPTDEPKEAA